MVHMYVHRSVFDEIRFRKDVKMNFSSIKLFPFMMIVVCAILLTTVATMEQQCDNVPIVTFEEVLALKDNKTVLLVDVRNPNELEETGEIPGSINIPLGDLIEVLSDTSAEYFKQKYGRDKPGFDFPLVFSCRSGRRSLQASCMAISLGYKNVRNYAGSWLEWEQKIKQV